MLVRVGRFEAEVCHLSPRFLFESYAALQISLFGVFILSQKANVVSVATTMIPAPLSDRSAIPLTPPIDSSTASGRAPPPGIFCVDDEPIEVVEAISHYDDMLLCWQPCLSADRLHLVRV